MSILAQSVSDLDPHSMVPWFRIRIPDAKNKKKRIQKARVVDPD
jgi:hypothetical protein